MNLLNFNLYKYPDSHLYDKAFLVSQGNVVGRM
jgi:hypothetical protein